MDCNTDNKTKHSLWSRKISIWHIVYLVIICLIFNVFLLCIVPGRINEDAYQNFSFAATITSIVLAVVSIVYSLQSGLSSVVQLNGIKDIEAKIGTELTRFANLEASIKNAVREGITPLEASMGDIKQRQDEISKSQDILANNWRELMQTTMSVSEKTTETTAEESESTTQLLSVDAPQIFYVILYTCICSHKTQMDIPYHVLGQFFGVRRYYCEGVINSLATFNRNSMKLEVGSKHTRQVVSEYNESELGSKEWLRKQVLEGKNTRLGNDIIHALDEYYTTTPSKDDSEG